MTVALLFTQTATVETYAGQTGYGDTWAAPVTVFCFVDDGLQLVASGVADTVTAKIVLYAPMETASLFAIDSRVTVNDLPHRVTAVHRRELSVYSAANHVEVELT